ncbi:MAG: hypothetical protein MJ174_02985 [Treponema sp.]|nr:hypothetical protein [Treponema sp.]
MRNKFLMIITLSIIFTSCASSNKVETELTKETWSTIYTYVFVHGLSGWGHYDTRNAFFPYWGMRNGSLIKYLNNQGITAADASVAPQGSVWDRVCELYAQLTGTVTDYGLEHSTRCNHPRYGRDFSKDPLIKKWDAENKINILGHSFGGVTVRLLAHLMENGAPAEINATPKEELSPLFSGGHGDWIYSVTTLAAPHNGTTAYHISDPEPEKKSGGQKMMSKANTPKKDGRADYDYADFDMHINNADAINKWLKTLTNAYYFSFSCSATIQQEDGTYKPDTNKMESLFQRSSELMGAFEGANIEGIEVTKEWQENDGLVNTISALAPSHAPGTRYDSSKVVPGVWNIMPVYYGDHMSLQGGLWIKNDVRDFYLTHINRINNLK